MSIGKGENTAIIQLKLRLLNYVNEHCGKEKQSRGFYIAKRWLMSDPDIPEDLKKEMLEWYSKTNIQQHEENELEKQAKAVRAEARAKIEALKKPRSPEEKALENEKQQVIALLEQRQKELAVNPDSKHIQTSIEVAHKQLADLDEKLAKLKSD